MAKTGTERKANRKALTGPDDLTSGPQNLTPLKHVSRERAERKEKNGVKQTHKSNRTRHDLRKLFLLFGAGGWFRSIVRLFVLTRAHTHTLRTLSFAFPSAFPFISGGFGLAVCCFVFFPPFYHSIFNSYVGVAWLFELA